jgi:hypothetical protein
LPHRQSGRIQRQESRQCIKCRSARADRRLKIADVDPINAIKDAECQLLQFPANSFMSDHFDAELGGLSIPRDTS